MSGVRGNVRTLRELGKKLKSLPVTLAQRVAARSAPKLSGRGRAAYTGGTTVYGDPRPAGKHGNSLSLVASGQTLATLRIVAVGRIVRAALGTRWAKYLVGKYGVLPNGRLPATWSKDIHGTTTDEIGRHLKGGR